MASYKSKIIRHLGVSAIITLVLTSLLTWWLISWSLSAYQTARNRLIQFDAFHRVLLASNALASERAYANELILDKRVPKTAAWRSLVQQRRITDHALMNISQNILSPALLQATRAQLAHSRNVVDTFRFKSANNAADAQRAIDKMVVATDFYHDALFRKTSEFIQLAPSALGQILRAQALGELRDATGRLGSALLIPLHTRTPIPTARLEALSRGFERIHTQWWILENRGNDVRHTARFNRKLAQTRQQFETQGEGLIKQLILQSRQGGHYPIDAATFAVRYHDSLRSFNALLDIYLSDILTHYMHLKQDALAQLLLVLSCLLVLYSVAIRDILYVRSQIIKPLLQLNHIAASILNGNAVQEYVATHSSEEVKELLTSLGMLESKINQQNYHNQRLQQLSEQDPLTGLANRRAFDLQASQLLQTSGSHQPVWLVLVDIDRFKQVNDTWGHPAGDKVLVAIGNVLRSCCRKAHLVARIGGEEFALLFQHTDADTVADSLSKLQEQIRQLAIAIPGTAIIRVTASFGVARAYNDGLSDLLQAADRELYNAKNRGRDRICGLPGPAALAPHDVT